VDHDNYRHSLALPVPVRDALRRDLD